MPVRLPVVGSPSRTETACRCYRRHYLQDVIQYELYRSPALSFGTVMHEGVGVFWQMGGPQAGLMSYAAGLEAMTDEWKRLLPDGAKHTLESATKMYEAYTANAVLAGPFPGDYTPFLIEKRNELEFGGRILSYKVDRAVENQDDGSLVILDLKTASKINDKWHGNFNRTLQMKLYKYAMMFQYERDVQVCIEGLSKDPRPKFEYHICPQWDHDTLLEAFHEWERHAIMDEEFIQMAFDRSTEEGREVWDCAEEIGVLDTPFNYGDCYSYFIECPFYRLCTAPPSMRHLLLKADYTRVESDLDNG